MSQKRSGSYQNYYFLDIGEKLFGNNLTNQFHVFLITINTYTSP